MDAWIVGAAVFAATLVMFGVLRKRVTDLERIVLRLQGRLDDLERRPADTRSGANPAAAPHPAAPNAIDIEPFVE